MWENSDFEQTHETNGFLNNSQTAVENHAQTKKEKRLQSVVPVVVGQLINHPNDDFTLFGLPAQILNIVGILRNIDVQSTKATYTVEDHTGGIKCVFWLENDDNATPNLPNVKVGGYVQCFGILRNQNGEKNLMVLQMYSVEDCNVVTTHLLSAIKARLEAEDMSKNVGSKYKVNNPGAALANSMSFMDQSTSDVTFTHVQQKIQTLLKIDKSIIGMTRREILAHFPVNQHKEFSEAMDYLMNEGYIFSTIDDDHFKATPD
ncbi:unnamed protein product [Brassicogethes aeneus]|uniref:Replication protein A 32 kDa subunit n=1 Tax=Brassicogethes aeneus TaxID=1431903 RepID=A0A9P0FEK6_BRAAE|nr:unnamed protein product [Brassicogethes aeneus]